MAILHSISSVLRGAEQHPWAESHMCLQTLPDVLGSHGRPQSTLVFWRSRL